MSGQINPATLQEMAEEGGNVDRDASTGVGSGNELHKLLAPAPRYNEEWNRVPEQDVRL
jgi:hypothetical protein